MIRESTSSQETTVGPSHWANARPRFLASSRSSCLRRHRENNRRGKNADQTERKKKFQKEIQNVTSSSSCGPSRPGCPVSPESWCRRCPSQSLQAQQTAVHFHICGHMCLHPPSVCSGPVSAGRGSLPIVCSIRPPFSFFPNKRPIDDLILFFGFLAKMQNNAPSGKRTIYSPPDAVHHCVRACV